MSASVIGCERTGGEGIGRKANKTMTEQVIQTKRGTFGKVQITLPMTVKENILTWHKNSGLGKAEFCRVAFMVGASILAGALNARKPDENFCNDDCSEGENEQP